MADKNDPAWLLREAWGVVRLDAIRKVVNEIIGRLRELTPEQLLCRQTASTAAQVAINPIAEACEACSNELRDACGMPVMQHVGRTREESMKQRLTAGPDWAAEYHEALGKYRNFAGRALREWLRGVCPAHDRSVLEAVDKRH